MPFALCFSSPKKKTKNSDHTSFALSERKHREIETKGMRRPFLLIPEAAIVVTEVEEIEPKTVKDPECQTIDFDYKFQIIRYQTPNKDSFETDF